MSSFCVLENSSKREIEIIKIGFSWKAFFLTFFWGFANKLWAISSIYLIILFLLRFALDDGLFYLYIFTSSLFWGIYGNDILINYYSQKLKFEVVKLTSASSQNNAFFTYKT